VKYMCLSLHVFELKQIYMLGMQPFFVNNGLNMTHKFVT